MPDLILLHAPSIYDFRKKTILYGPVADLIPSTTAFEMYPIGFASIAEYLERHGFQVRIVNLAVRMLNEPDFDVEEMVKRLKAPVFGIDLHWLVHCHGSIEIARLVKKYHPDSKLIFGGLSSSYFYRELLQFPEIDFVMRGDSTEEPLRQFMECIKTGSGVDNVPNLVWKDNAGKISENHFSYIPADLDNIMQGHFGNIIRSVVRYRDFASTVPFKNWVDYPITAVLTCRGCTDSCVICGGSSAAFRKCYNRGKPAYRSPEMVAQDVKQIERFSGGPIFILGDLRQPGEKYAEQVFNLLKKSPVKNQIMFELFRPAPREMLQNMSEVCSNFALEMSPESHDTEIMKASGRNYTREGIEQTIADALNVGCGRIDIYFMIGVPKQTPASVMETIDYCDYLYNKFKGDKRLILFIAVISPFLDPGSLGFEQPDRHGYRVIYKTLKEHRQALLSPSWKHVLNYETQWMTRDQIVETAYEAILRLNAIKKKYGIISAEMAETCEVRLTAAREMVHRLDAIIGKANYEEELAKLKPEIDEINGAPVVERTQLELPRGDVGLKRWQALSFLLKRPVKL